ncbi:hypothetical protein ACQEWB_19295 [Streptomyces sp. CA-249302]|uniref:hypothetical protein n=1 Tax=Streptomyces sp. CA-249302 TaxID=3240058 RepID=UPI003D8D45F1
MRAKKWREDAQPEWPDEASGTQAVPAAEDPYGQAVRMDADRSDPVTGWRAFGESGTSRSGVPPTGGRPGDTFRQAPRDPWESSADPAHTHDPHEVTVQLDAVALQQDLRLRKAEGDGAEGGDGPVFVDESGRRSRRFRRLGIAVAMACAVYAVVIVVTLLSGSSDAPWLPVPGQQDEQPAGQVEPSTVPTESAPPSDSAGVSPGATPSAGGGTTPSADASGSAPGATAGSRGTDASSAPEPTATRTTAKPGTGAGDPDPSTSADPTSAAPDPSPSESPVTPTESAVGPGTATVADGPSMPRPLAEDRAAPGTSRASPSPENLL